jgi:hypothetical protein
MVIEGFQQPSILEEDHRFQTPSLVSNAKNGKELYFLDVM